MRWFFLRLRVARWFKTKKILRQAQKLIVLFSLFWFLLGTLPLSEWEKLDADAFLNAIGFAFSQANQCSCEIKAMGAGETVFIFGQCQEVSDGEDLLLPSVPSKVRL